MLELSVTAYNVVWQLMRVQLVLILMFFLYYLDSCYTVNLPQPVVVCHYNGYHLITSI